MKYFGSASVSILALTLAGCAMPEQATIPSAPAQVVSTPSPLPPLVRAAPQASVSVAAPVAIATTEPPAFEAPMAAIPAPAPMQVAALPPVLERARALAAAPAPVYAPAPSALSAPAFPRSPAPSRAYSVSPQPLAEADQAARTTGRYVTTNATTSSALRDFGDRPVPFPRAKPSPKTPEPVQTAAAAETFRFSARPTGSGGNYLSMGTPPSIEYTIPHLPQEEPLWCWAAAAQQAIGWVNNGRAPAQCAIVALAHGIPVKECCADREGVCARTGEIPAIAELVQRYGGVARELPTVPRDPRQIYEILQKNSTLLIRLRPAPHDQAVGIRHMIVVRGIEWLRLPNNELNATLLYNDPLGEGERAVSFNEIVGFFEQALMITRRS